MRLIAFKYGATEITERMAFQDGSEDVKLPVSLLFFLIEHKNKKIHYRDLYKQQNLTHLLSYFLQKVISHLRIKL